MGCSSRIAAGVPSRLLPPWLDTEIASTPASTARRASSTRQTPLSMNGVPLIRPHCSRIQATSSQRRRRGGHPLVVGPEERRAPSPPSGRGEVRRGEVGEVPGAAELVAASAAWSPPSAPCAPWSSGRPSRGSPGCPSRGPWRTTSPGWRSGPIAPAVWARSMRCTITSRSPVQYIWKSVRGLAATTSSTGLEAKLRQPHQGAARCGGAGDGDLAVGVHRLDAGRADQHRQRDLLAQHRAWPCDRSACWPATCGGSPSSANAAWLSRTVCPARSRRPARRTPGRAAASAPGAGRPRPTRTRGSASRGSASHVRHPVLGRSVIGVRTRRGGSRRSRRPEAGTADGVISFSSTGWLRVGTVREWSWLTRPGSCAPGERRARRTPARTRGRGRPAAGR